MGGLPPRSQTTRMVSVEYQPTYNDLSKSTQSLIKKTRIFYVSFSFTEGHLVTLASPILDLAVYSEETFLACKYTINLEFE